MSGKNLVRKEFLSDGTWVCPGGVQQVRVLVFGQLSTQIDAGAGSIGHMAGVTQNGSIYTWGGGANGQNGTLATLTPVSSPVVVVGSYAWNALGIGVDNQFGVSQNGDGYAWGLNTNGQLGVASTASFSSPVLITGGLKWRTISGGSSAVGLTPSGAAYAWGLNTNGQLGLGDVIPRSSPVLVLGGKSWRQVVSGRSNFMMGVATDGLIYGWGANANGQLGVGDVTPRSSPVVIAGANQWLSVSASAGAVSGAFSIGITQAGDAYAWGVNTNGQLGDGTTVAKSSPVLVLGGLKWRSIKCGGDSVVGITRDGLAYAWGKNESGQLGDGSVVSKSSPVLVVGGYTFRQIAMGVNTGSNLGYACGVSTNGNIYAWGSNANGQLGTGDTTTRSSPTIVVGANVWRAIDNALLAEQIVTVSPGTTYAVTQLAAVSSFGPTGLFVDSYGSGSIPTRMTLEYFA